MRPARALAALVALCVAVPAGGAGALSWSRASCETFQRSTLDHAAVVRARVARTWNPREGEEERSAEVEATVREAITGRLPRGSALTFKARASEISGVQFGFIPAEGDEIILFIDRDADRRFFVKWTMPAREWDAYWVRRCAF